MFHFSLLAFLFLALLLSSLDHFVSHLSTALIISHLSSLLHVVSLIFSLTDFIHSLTHSLNLSFSISFSFFPLIFTVCDILINLPQLTNVGDNIKTHLPPLPKPHVPELLYHTMTSVGVVGTDDVFLGRWRERGSEREGDRERGEGGERGRERGEQGRTGENRGEEGREKWRER